jgi:hypothetical protein
MRKAFDIKYRPQIESGEYKVKTESGQDVRIVCWDMNTCNGTLIVALVKGYGGEYEKMRSYTLEGKCKSASEKASLVIEAPDELTEFERVLTDILVGREYDGKLETEGDVDKAYEVFGKVAQELSPRLLAAAKKQIDSHFDDELKEIRETTEKAQYQRGYTDGKADILKDIPQWHRLNNYLDNKADFYVGIEKQIHPSWHSGTSLSVDVLRVGNRYLVISELKDKLQTEG